MRHKGWRGDVGPLPSLDAIWIIVVLQSNPQLYREIIDRAANFPVTEREAIHTIAINLQFSDMRLANFFADLRLFDLCAAQTTLAKQLLVKNPSDNEAKKAERDFGKFIFVACRDGAMNIYHFGRTVEAIRETVNQCPEFRETLDIKALRDAGKLFRRHFPDFEKLRHGVAHSAERMKTPNAFRKHEFTGTYTIMGEPIGENDRLMLVDSLHNRTFSNSWEGQIVSYDVTLLTYSKLVAVRMKLEAAFQPGHDLS